MGIAVDPTTGHIFVADTINNRIVELSADPGGTDIPVRDAHRHGFDKPEAIEVAADGTIYVADTNDSEIVMLSAAAACWPPSARPTASTTPPARRWTRTGDVYVSDSFNDRVLVYSKGIIVPDDEAPGGDLQHAGRQRHGHEHAGHGDRHGHRQHRRHQRAPGHPGQQHRPDLPLVERHQLG